VKTPTALVRFAWLTLAYNIGVILWGAYVRATGSGAGCGEHWPLCNGVMIPRDPSAATVIEFSHRLTSGLALVAVMVVLVWVWRVFAAGHPARRGAAWTVLFMLTEAAVGAGLVLFQLVADNATMARAMFMAVHLLNTFTLLAAMTLTAWWVSGGAPIRLRDQRRAAAFVVGALGLLLVGTSGAVAALGDTLFPDGSLANALAADLSPTSHILVRLRFLHPVFALVVGAGLIIGTGPLAAGRGRLATRLAITVIAIAVMQLALGFVNVILLAPVWMQMVHLLVADVLWIAFVLLGASVLTAPSEGFAYSLSGTPEGPSLIASAGLDSSSNTRV
jgi:cytochrome c oxidase assembly protein subunit 15